MDITVTLLIKRMKVWQKFAVQVPDTAYVLDALEQAWRQDHSLLFRHSCHHASCGSCGMRINNRERLACITLVSSVMDRHHTIRLEPLRNFTLIKDLVVDTSSLMENIALLDLPLTRSCVPDKHFEPLLPGSTDHFERFENCIECGLCISSCPISATCSDFLGPAVLAAADRLVAEPRGRTIEAVISCVDGWNGLWRCHHAFECSEVCPMDVAPGQAIANLRHRLIFGK
jgi:succinate dehydrogenase / fumarate reductase, iron-sulfur subunit